VWCARELWNFKFKKVVILANSARQLIWGRWITARSVIKEFIYERACEKWRLRLQVASHTRMKKLPTPARFWLPSKCTAPLKSHTNFPDKSTPAPLFLCITSEETTHVLIVIDFLPLKAFNAVPAKNYIHTHLISRSVLLFCVIVERTQSTSLKLSLLAKRKLVALFNDYFYKFEFIIQL